MGLVAEMYGIGPQIVTGTKWKFDVIANNFRRFAQEENEIAFLDRNLLNEPNQLPIGVKEKDSMLGNPTLIVDKATDQILKMFAMVAGKMDGNTQEEVYLPARLVDLIADGGRMMTVATDVAVRQRQFYDARPNSNWRRLLNFSLSSRGAHDPNIKVEDLMGELLAYYDDTYPGGNGQRCLRAVDAMIALADVQFSVRTSKHRATNTYYPPDVKVYPACETAGVLMDVDVLADKRLRREFVEFVIAQRAMDSNMSPAQAIRDLNGRAGGADALDLHHFCEGKGILTQILINSKSKDSQEREMRSLVHGGSYKLFRALMRNLHDNAGIKQNSGFVAQIYPVSSTDRALVEI